MTRTGPFNTAAVRLMLLAVLALPFGSRSARAQSTDFTVACAGALAESNSICLGEVARSDSVQQFEVVLRVSGRAGPVANITIAFKADSGTLVRDTAITNQQGEARTIWYRPRGAGTVGIAADVRTASGSILKYIQLQPRVTRLRLQTAQDATLANFPGGSGRRLIVEIRREAGTGSVPITKAAECAEHRVVFVPEGTGARVTPDTASGVVYDAKPRGSPGPLVPGCFASARVALGSEVGLHEIRTIGLPSPGHRVVANARFQEVNVRHLPQIIVAGVASLHPDFTRLDRETTRTYRVQRVLPSGETASFDSAVVRLAPTEAGGGSTTAMVGFSTPIPWIGAFVKPANLLNITFGLDPVEPRRGQFLGLSFLRSSGWVPQNFPIDLHVLAHVRHIDRVTDPEGCAKALREDACETRSRNYWGPAIAVSFDASAVIAEALKKLAN